MGLTRWKFKFKKAKWENCNTQIENTWTRS